MIAATWPTTAGAPVAAPPAPLPDENAAARRARVSREEEEAGAVRARGIPNIPGLSCPALERGLDPGRAGRGIQVASGAADAPPVVLVAEPQTALSDAIAGALRQEGFEVCTAADGVAAVYGLRHHWPDAVVLDPDLPGVSGFRLMHLLKHDRTADPVPVLLVTSLSFDEALDAIRVGADDLLELPISPAEVVWRVRRLLGDPRLPVGITALAAANESAFAAARPMEVVRPH